MLKKKNKTETKRNFQKIFEDLSALRIAVSVSAEAEVVKLGLYAISGLQN